VEHIIRANRQAVVIVDEAYIDFGGVSVLPLLEKYDNLLIVRTFSKSRSMAGMRIGFALGSEKLISYLSDVKFSFNSYTMNLPALRAGVASIEAEDYFRKTLAKIVATREWTKKELEKLGFTFPDSKSNFIFATHKSIPAQELFAMLKDSGIYVRYFRKPRIDNYLRISIGTEKEMHALIDFLKNYISCQ
jgi:histidinol-phosphate aminotransferase